MYTNGLKDRFGSPLISMRDLLKYWNENLPTYEFLDARGANTTENDLWGTTMTVSTQGTKVTITHKDNKLSFLPTSFIKDGTNVANDKVNVNGTLVNIQPQNVISSDGCTNTIILSLMNPNTKFSSLKVLKGEETLGEAYNQQDIVIELSDVEKIENTRFKSFSFVETDFPKLTVASGVFGGAIVESIIGDYPSLYWTSEFSSNATSLFEVKCNFPLLLVAENMFSGCSSLYNFIGDLSNLVTAKGMFANTDLTPESVRYIWKSLSTISSFHTDYADMLVKDDNGERYVIPINYCDVVNGEPTMSVQTVEIPKDDIGKITISWADLDSMAAEDKAIILRELFPLIRKKGWSIETNLTTIFDPIEE